MKLAVTGRLRTLRLFGAEPATTADRQQVVWLRGLGTQQRRDAEHAALLAAAQALGRLQQQLPQLLAANLEPLGRSVVELGLAVAKEIVGSALERGLVDPTPIVASVLRDCVHGSGTADLTVRLHPDDLALVLGGLAKDPELRPLLAATQLVADGNLPRGAVRADTAAGRLRYEPQQALLRLADEIRRAAEGGQ